MSSSRLHLSAWILLIAILSGCGRANTVYTDDATPGIVGTDGRSFLPQRFADQSVNHAVVDIDPAGPSLRFQILTGTNAAGSFNDSSLTGNRALLGIGAYDQSLLSAFTLSITSSSSSSSQLTASLIVDLDCTGTQPSRTLISTPLSTGTASLSPADSAWSVAGPDLVDSANHVLVPSTTQNAPVNLNDLLVTYPNACLKNDRSDADDAPKNIPLGGVLLSLGSGTSTAAETVEVSVLTINGDTYQTWGQR